MRTPPFGLIFTARLIISSAACQVGVPRYACIPLEVRVQLFKKIYISYMSYMSEEKRRGVEGVEVVIMR